jgi:hypothetical protein
MTDYINDTNPVPNADYNGLYGWQHLRSAKASVGQLAIKEPLNIKEVFFYNDGLNPCISAFNNRNQTNTGATNAGDVRPIIPNGRTAAPPNEEWQLEAGVVPLAPYDTAAAALQADGTVTLTADTSAEVRIFVKYTIQAINAADVGKTITVSMRNNTTAADLAGTESSVVLPALGKTVTGGKYIYYDVALIANGNTLQVGYTCADALAGILCTNVEYVIANA